MTAKTRLKYHERSDVVGKPALNATDTDVIEIGQKLCIPGGAAVEELVAAFEEAPQTPITAEPKLVWVDQAEYQMVEGEYIATLVGNFRDSCSTPGEVDTAVTNDTIVVTALADSPPGVMSALGLFPFEQTITLDLSEIEPAEYTVVVNETATIRLTVN